MEGLMLKLKLPYLATWWEELTHWKKPWCWERLKAGGERDNREWDGWMASLTWWTWIWANSGREWRTEKPGVLQSMGLQIQTWLSNWAKSVVILLDTYWEIELLGHMVVVLQSMGSLGVRHDWATSLSLFTFMHWRRTWQPTPVFLPGESQGRGSLVGCCLWGLHRVGHDWSDLAAAAAAWLLLLLFNHNCA